MPYQLFSPELRRHRIDVLRAAADHAATGRAAVASIRIARPVARRHRTAHI